MLNAFRHQRSEHRSSTALNSRSSVCSTPFGIKDRNTGLVVKNWQLVSDAQRLSASKIGTLAFPNHGSGHKLCSTPFGIKDRNTQRAEIEPKANTLCSTPFGIKDRNTSVSPLVPYQGCSCSTPFGIKDRNTAWPTSSSDCLINAQRLSASKIGTPGLGDTIRTRYVDAQRLSASKIGTHPKSRPTHCFPPMLNAFRHQRSEHS